MKKIDIAKLLNSNVTTSSDNCGPSHSCGGGR